MRGSWGGVASASLLPSPIESRKPFTAPPRSEPMERSFLAPNNSSTINKTTIKWTILIPIASLRSNLTTADGAHTTPYRTIFYTPGAAPRLASLWRPLRLFHHAGQAAAPVQFRQHVVRVQSLLGQQHQGMIPFVGDLMYDLIVAAVLCRLHCLGGLFADLFEYGVQALGIEAGDIRTRGIGLFARFQHCGQPGQHLTHGPAPDISRQPASTTGPPTASGPGRGAVKSSSRGRCGRRCRRPARR